MKPHPTLQQCAVRLIEDHQRSPMIERCQQTVEPRKNKVRRYLFEMAVAAFLAGCASFYVWASLASRGK